MAKPKSTKTETAKPEVAASPKVEAAFVMTDEQRALMKQVIDATQGVGGFGYVNKEVISPLVEAGFVEINEQIHNDAGEIAARATAKGVESMATAEASNATEATVLTNKPAEVPGNGFALVANVPIPSAAKKGGRGGSAYPFEKMEVGQSFFIPVTEDKPEPWKQYASTVSSATQRFAVEVPGETREKKTLVVDADGKPVLNDAGKKQYNDEQVPKTKPTRIFIIRKVDDGAPWGKPGIAGAGVWRSE